MTPDPALQAATMRLPASLDLKVAASLAAQLLAARGGDLTLEAADVRRLGGQCLQVLLSAQATWAADGAGFRIAVPSNEFRDACALMGATSLCASPIDQEPHP
jgi:chemotaxis protein CheX